MGIAVGLSLVGASLAFTPAALFSAKEKGGWYDPSDLSTLFQDSAGTTPVTAAGQPVGKMLDKSGNGNHLIQATSAQCPTFQIDGTGRPYLSFDGVDDGLATAATIDLSAVAQVLCVAGIYKVNETPTASVLEFGPNSGTESGFRMVAPAATSPFSAIAHYGATSTAFVNANNPAAPVALVLSGQFNLAAPRLVHRVNASASVSNTGATGGGFFGNKTLFIGRRNRISMPFLGRIYGIICLARTASAIEVSAAEAWMNGKTGAY